MNHKNIYDADVLIIGGGASGMMAAISAARSGASVIVIEKNKRLGEKLRVSGGGRCNITNSEPDTRIFLKNYGVADKFLFSSFARFGVQDTLAFFDDIGISTQVESRNRIFPVCQSAEAVADSLVDEMIRLNVRVVTAERVVDIVRTDGMINLVKTDKSSYQAKNYILASGGLSRPETGSTGDGFDWLKELGHIVKPPTPGITPLKLSDKWLSQASGKLLENVKLTFVSQDSTCIKAEGNVLVTHFGISGPTVLNVSSQVKEMLDYGPVRTSLDFFPKLDAKELDLMLSETFNRNGSKQLGNVLGMCMPAVVLLIIKSTLSELNFDQKTSEVSREVRLKIVNLLKHMPINVTGLMGLEKAVVVDGGVDLSEIDTRTFASKKISNLYVTGDLLDINRPSGGFSLQLCWTSGFVSGVAAASKI
jgi:predicted Rossmann fold flavoprotein